MRRRPDGNTYASQFVKGTGATVSRLSRKTAPDGTRQGPLADEMIRELRTELYLVDRAIAALIRLYALRQGQEPAKRGRHRT